MRPARPKSGRDAVRAHGRAADVLLRRSRPGTDRGVGLRRRSTPRGEPRARRTARSPAFGSTGPYARLKALRRQSCGEGRAVQPRDVRLRRRSRVLAGNLTASTGAAHLAVSGIARRADRARDEPAGASGSTRRSCRASSPPTTSASTTCSSRSVPRPPVRRRRSEHCAGRRDGREPIRALHLHRVTAAGSASHRSNRTRRMRSCASIGLEDTLDDERFAHAPFFRTAEDAQEWEDLLWERSSARRRGPSSLPRCSRRTTCRSSCAARSEEALDHPQIVANGEVVEVDDPVLGTVREVGPVAHVRAEPVGDRTVGAGARRACGRSRADRTAPQATVRHPRARVVGRHHRRVRLLLRDAVRGDARGVARRARHQARGRRRRPDAPRVRRRRGIGQGDGGQGEPVDRHEDRPRAARSCTSSSRAPMCSCSGSARASRNGSASTTRRCRRSTRSSSTCTRPGTARRVRTATDRCTRAPRSRSPGTCTATPASGWTPSCRPTSASSSCRT